MANQEQVDRLKQGAEGWNKWRKENPEIKIDLSKVDLRGAVPIEANLGEVNLGEADLRNADLSEANLRDADLNGANLCGADLKVRFPFADIHEIFSDTAGQRPVKGTFRKRAACRKRFADVHGRWYLQDL